MIRFSGRPIVFVMLIVGAYPLGDSLDEENNIASSYESSGQYDQKVITERDLFKAVVSIEINCEHVATGVLINDLVVLTTASTLSNVDPETISVRISGTPLNQGTLYEVQRVIIHERFRSKSNYNDIALIQLTGNDLQNSKHARNSSSWNSPQAGICIQIGKGWLRGKSQVLALAWDDLNGSHKQQTRSQKHRTRSQNLQYHLVKVQSNLQCQFDSLPVLINGFAQFCIDDNDNGLIDLQGDPGSPIFHKGKVVGLASVARRNGDMVRVYVRVAYYSWWIQRKLRVLKEASENRALIMPSTQ